MFNKISCFFSAVSLGGLYYQHKNYSDLSKKRAELIDQIDLNHVFQKKCNIRDPSMLATQVKSGLELKEELRETDEKLQRSFACTLVNCSEEVPPLPRKSPLLPVDQACFQHFPHGWNTFFDLHALYTNQQDARLRNTLLARSQNLLDHFDESGPKVLARELEKHPAEDRDEEAEMQKAASIQFEKFVNDLRQSATSLHTITQNLQEYEQTGCFDADSPVCHERKQALLQQLEQVKEEQDATESLLLQESEALMQAAEKGFKHHRAMEFWKKEVTAEEIKRFAQTSGKAYATISLHFMHKMLENVWLTQQLSLRPRK